MNAPRASTNVHPDPSRAAVIDTIRAHGRLSARSVLRFHPELKDTVGSTRFLKGLVDTGYLHTNQEEGRNATFSIPVAEPAAAAPAQKPATTAPQRESLQADQQVIVEAARAHGSLSMAEVLALPTGRPMTRPQAKHRLQLLIAQGRLEMTGHRASARYRAVGAAAGASMPPAAHAAIPVTRALLEAVQAERRMYAELLMAAMGSIDPTVRRLALAANGIGGVVDGLME